MYMPAGWQAEEHLAARPGCVRAPASKQVLVQVFGKELGREYSPVPIEDRIIYTQVPKILPRYIPILL